MRKIYTIHKVISAKTFAFSSFLSLSSLLINQTSYSQCTPDVTPPVITCPSGDITINNDPGNCSAVVNFGTATATDNCTVFTESLTYNYTGTIQTFTVPPGVTSITIEVNGAQGGNGDAGTGGLGAFMSGEFTVVPGQVLNILVGQQPTSSNGGGGGSFVVDLTTGNPLIIAGGGGGGAGSCCGIIYNGEPGVTTQNGSDGINASGGVGIGGSSGNGGGNGGQGQSSGAGGGFLSDGADGDCSSTGGLSYQNGGAGGNSGGSPNMVGGYGGGGGGHNCGWAYGAGGGGGGYSGGGNTGGGSQWGGGGGGGSFNAGINQVNNAGANSGNGIVTIMYNGNGVINQIAGLTSGSSFPVGTTTVTFEAIDESSNSTTCSFNVEVIDVENPIPDVTNLTDFTADCIINSIPAPTATDNCGTVNGTPDVTFPITTAGTTVITWTYEDASGNITTQTQNAIVNITAIDVTTTYSNVTDISANNSSATGYQWLSSTDNCTTYSEIAGATNQLFTALNNGYYAVEITEGACVDTSDCITVAGIGFSEFDLSNITIYPNPSNGIFTLNFGKLYHSVLITITDASGKVVETYNFNDVSQANINFNGSEGIYLIQLSADNIQTTKILIKE